MPVIRIAALLFMIGLMPLLTLSARAGTEEQIHAGKTGDRLEILLSQARQQVEEGNPQGLHTATMAELLADSLHKDYEKACAWELQGIAWKIKGDNQQSITYLFQALSYFQKEEYRQEYAGALRNIGETNRAAGNLHQAMNFLSTSLAISVKEKDTAGMARTYDRMAAVSYELHFSDSNSVAPEYQPLEHAEFNFRLKMRSDDTFKTKYDQTIRYISLARFYAGKAHLPRVLISTSMIRAALYTITYQFSEALVVYQYLEQEIQQTGAALERPLLNYNIALLYFKKKEFSKALAYAKEGHRLAEELKVPQYQFLLSGFIGLIHHRLGDFKEAYHYSHLSYLGRLAYFENDLNVKLRAMQLDYEIRNKKEELLSRKLQIIWLIVIIVFVTGITTLFIIVLMRKNNTMKRLNESLEQRVAERTRELEQSNRELAFRIREAEQYTYIASHDLQEPLQTLTNFTGLLMEEYNNVISGEGKRYLEYIGQATTKMSSLVKGFLDYSLLEKKENNGAIDCNRLLQTILGEMSADIIQAGAAIELEDLPAITGSAADIRTLFVHLLRNAIQYRQPGLPLQIRISARTDPSEWRFFIEDNGTGIPEKERSRVFDIFRKGRRHVDNQSAGLGLAYCRKIVELHGGKIWAEPALLAGTIINFTIPKPQRYDQKAEQHIAGG